MRHIKTFEQYNTIEQTDEGLVSGVKKLFGQLKEWKLDGSYKGSDKAIDYLAKHPSAKIQLRDFISKGLSQKQAEEAVLHVFDWGGKINWKDVAFNKETNVLSLEPPKGVNSPNPMG